jgi:uncharacterized cupin superfamily protein
LSQRLVRPKPDVKANRDMPNAEHSAEHSPEPSPEPSPKRTPVAALALPPISSGGYPPPFDQRMGQGDWRAMGNHFGLTQFGVNLETLHPQAQSALRHWHTLADEFVYVLEGELTLRNDDGEFVLSAGMCMGFKAGDKNAHHLVNHSAAVARFIVMGSRVPGDNAFYPDDDLAWLATEQGKLAVHKDGTPYPSV